MSEPPQYPSAPDPDLPPSAATPPPRPPYGGYGTPPGTPPPPPPAPPAYGAPGGPYGGPPAYDVMAAVSYGWKGFVANVGPLVLLGLLAFLLPAAISVVGQMLQSGGSLAAERAGTDTGMGLAAVGAGGIVGFAVGVVAQIVSLFFGAALVRAAFDVTEGRRVELGAAFSRWDKGQVIVLAVLSAVATMIGFVLCILPGIVVMFFLYFSTYFVVGSGQGAIDAIRASFRFTADHLGPLLLLALLSIVIAIVGACACGVGLLVAMPVVTIAAAYTFRFLQGQPVAAV